MTKMYQSALLLGSSRVQQRIYISTSDLSSSLSSPIPLWSVWSNTIKESSHSLAKGLSFPRLLILFDPKRTFVPRQTFVLRRTFFPRRTFVLPTFGKTTITVQRAAAAITAFYFTISREDRGLAGLTPNGATTGQHSGFLEH